MLLQHFILASSQVNQEIAYRPDDVINFWKAAHSTVRAVVYLGRYKSLKGATQIMFCDAIFICEDLGRRASRRFGIVVWPTHRRSWSPVYTGALFDLNHAVTATA